jgi:hypothetical protein
VNRNLTAHEPHARLPCLCRDCLGKAPDEATLEGLAFKRVSVNAAERVLHAWYPVELEGELPRLRASMERRLAKRYATKWHPNRPLATQPGAEPAKPGLLSRLRNFFGV